MLKELIADLHKLDTRWIELVGRGKPTFHPNFDQIVEMLKDHRFTVGIATNGTLLTPKQCKHLIHCRLDRIIVSLNAGTRDTYPVSHTAEKPEGFDKVIRSKACLLVRNANKLFCAHPRGRKGPCA